VITKYILKATPATRQYRYQISGENAKKGKPKKTGLPKDIQKHNQTGNLAGDDMVRISLFVLILTPQRKAHKIEP